MNHSELYEFLLKKLIVNSCTLGDSSSGREKVNLSNLTTPSSERISEIIVKNTNSLINFFQSENTSSSISLSSDLYVKWCDTYRIIIEDFLLRSSRNYHIEEVHRSPRIFIGPTGLCIDVLLDGSLLKKIIRSTYSEHYSADEEILSGKYIDREKFNYFSLLVEKPSGKSERELNTIELIAQITRHCLAGKSQKIRIRVNDEIRHDLYERIKVISNAKEDKKSCSPEQYLGGFTIFLLDYARRFGIDAVAYHDGNVPHKLFNDLLLEKQIPIINPDIHITDLKQCAAQTGQDLCIYHYSISFHGYPLLPGEFKTSPLTIDKKLYGPDFCSDANVIVSGHRWDYHFRLSSDRIRENALAFDSFLISGFQNLKTLDDALCYFDFLTEAKKASPSLFITLEYSDFKEKGIELEVLQILKERRVVDYMTFNTKEAYDMLCRFGENQEALFKHFPESKEYFEKFPSEENFKLDFFFDELCEHPLWVYASAHLIQKILQIPFVRVRAKHADVSIVTEEFTSRFSDPKVFTYAITEGRLAAWIKVALKGGAKDVQSKKALLIPYIDEKNLTALLLILNSLLLARQSSALEDNHSYEKKYEEYVQEYLQNGFVKNDDNNYVFLAVTPQFTITEGGTQGAGDINALFTIARLSETIAVMKKE
jgi:hypothetical protein